MRQELSADDQYAKALDDDLRILVVGAGIAGITVAQMLRRDGRNPVLVERARDESHAGYMLALMPMADRAIDDLGVRRAYLERSTPLDRYVFHTHTGRVLREDSMAAILEQYGDYRGIGRSELMEVLTTDECSIAYDTTVTAIDSAPDRTTVTLATPSGSRELDFDLVIVADGISSRTRGLVLGDHQNDTVDTGWGGWVVWAPADSDMDAVDELWGAGFFLGVYPIKGQLGVFLGGPREDMLESPAAFVAEVRHRLQTISARLHTALDAVLEDPDPYYWSLSDNRAAQWSNGRTVLLGDAAAGFLPTAGIGAGMAMESAWLLARMIRQAHPGNLESLPQRFERAQRPRVEAAQQTSRNLAGLMFRRSTALAVARDLAMRVVSVKAAIRPILALLREAPDPEALTGESNPADRSSSSPG